MWVFRIDNMKFIKFILIFVLLTGCGQKSSDETEIRSYVFNQLPGTEHLSLKNSQFFDWHGTQYLAATDMERGGTVILQYSGIKWEEYMLVYPGEWMMWAPNPVVIDNELWFFVCDHDGEEVIDGDNWTDNMRVYAHTVDIDTATYGPLFEIDIDGEEVGVIDPYIVKIGDWYYLFHARLDILNPDSYWDIYYSVSDNPLGPFKHGNRLDVNDRGIDEAFKLNPRSGFPFRCTWSSGDSGVDGTAFTGWVYIQQQLADGRFIFRVKETQEYESVYGTLCTALDITRWPKVVATLRYNDYENMRDRFYLGEYNH